MSESKTLFVLLHGYCGKPDQLASIRQAIEDDPRNRNVTSVFCIPKLPISLFSRADPCEIAADVVEQISTEDLAKRPDRIVLLGYSSGALLARKAYVIACGETAKAPFEKVIAQRTPVAWADKVDRIVLLAGMNRGWRISHHLGLGRAMLWMIGMVVAALLRPLGRRRLFIQDIHAGTEFISNLRIQWLRMRRRNFQGESKVGGAKVVQLLGSVDNFVAPTDTIDPITGADFIYLDVPFSGHMNIVDVAEKPEEPARANAVRAVRRDKILLAIFDTQDELEQAQIVPYDPNQQAVTCPEIKTVVFVIHGIRDDGYWTHKIARYIQKHSGHADTVATETSTYGYFPMLSFLLSAKRREKSEWLMDQYTEALACYPNATAIHFVGHSNGTYCLADALRRYPACHFDNVVFAGSVVRRGFRWDRIIRSSPERELYRLRYGSIGALVNIVATADWVVAAFPNLFQRWLPIQKLGGAGHLGFKPLLKEPAMSELRYAKGQHAAGIDEVLWPTLTKFILEGKAPRQPPERFAERQNLLVRLIGWVPPLVWFGIALLLLLIGKTLYWGASGLACRLGDAAAQCFANRPSLGATLHPSNWFAFPAALDGWIVPIAMLLYGLFIWKLLRWV